MKKNVTEGCWQNGWEVRYRWKCVKIFTYP